MRYRHSQALLELVEIYDVDNIMTWFSASYVQIAVMYMLVGTTPMVYMRYGLLVQRRLSMYSASLMTMGHGPCYNIASMVTQTSTEDGNSIVMVLAC